MLRLAAAVLLPYCLCAQSLVDYERQVHPILAAKCWSCHSQEKRSGGLSMATIYHALGIAPTQSFVVEKRPVYVTKDGKGKVIQELFA